MKNLLTANIQIAPTGGFKGFGILGFQGSDPSLAPTTFTNLISSVIGIMTLVAIIWFIFLLITGAISYMSAGGDKNNIETARKKITNAIVGLIIVIISIFIIKLIGTLIGIPYILDFRSLFAVVNTTINNQ